MSAALGVAPSRPHMKVRSAVRLRSVSWPKLGCLTIYLQPSKSSYLRLRKRLPDRLRQQAFMAQLFPRLLVVMRVMLQVFGFSA